MKLLKAVIHCNSLVLSIITLLFVSSAIPTVARAEIENQGDRSRPIFLHQVLEMALQNNAGIKGSLKSREAAEDLARAEYGIFEPRFIMSSNRNINERLNNTRQLLSQGFFATDEYFEENTAYSASIETTIPTGATIRIGSQWTKMINNLQAETLPQEYESYAGVSLRQPLLKDGGVGMTWARIRMMARRSEEALQETRNQMMSTLSRTEMAYWNLYAARKAYEFRQGSVDRARKLLEDNRARLKGGRMSEIEVTQAEAALALRETQLAEAELAVENAVAQLKTLIAYELDSGFSDLEPMDELDFFELDYDFQYSLEKAVRLQPTLLALEERFKQAGIRKKVAKNQRLPRVDLTASWGQNGLGQTKNESGNRLTRGGHESWFIGIECDVPSLFGIRERNELKAAKKQQESAELDLASARIDLENMLRAAIHNIKSIAGQVKQYEQVVSLNEKVLEGELANLDMGRGESRDVLRAEEDLTEARLSYLQSLLNYQRQIINIGVLEGTYLSNLGVDLMN